MNIWAIRPKEKLQRRPPLAAVRSAISPPPPSPPGKRQKKVSDSSSSVRGDGSSFAAITDTSGGGGSIGSSLALHRSARKWLDGCVNTSTLESALPSSEYWRERKAFRFYKDLHCVIERYAKTAKSALDVGSSLPPFINTLPWIGTKVILGPRFAGNVGKGGKEILSLQRIEAKFGVKAIKADFLAWQPPNDWQPVPGALPLYDLILCSEVVEHVESPSVFVRKLLAMGRVVVLSVPYLWDGCDHTRCHHKTNKISRQKIESWAGRPPQAFDIVEEANGDRRIICVYEFRPISSALSGVGRNGHLRNP